MLEEVKPLREMYRRSVIDVCNLYLKYTQPRPRDLTDPLSTSHLEVYEPAIDYEYSYGPVLIGSPGDPNCYSLASATVDVDDFLTRESKETPGLFGIFVNRLSSVPGFVRVLPRVKKVINEILDTAKNYEPLSILYAQLLHDSGVRRRYIEDAAKAAVEEATLAPNAYEMKLGLEDLGFLPLTDSSNYDFITKPFCKKRLDIDENQSAATSVRFGMDGLVENVHANVGFDKLENKIKMQKRVHCAYDLTVYAADAKEEEKKTHHEYIVVLKGGLGLSVVKGEKPTPGLLEKMKKLIKTRYGDEFNAMEGEIVAYRPELKDNTLELLTPIKAWLLGRITSIAFNPSELYAICDQISELKQLANECERARKDVREKALEFYDEANKWRATVDIVYPFISCDGDQLMKELKIGLKTGEDDNKLKNLPSSVISSWKKKMAIANFDGDDVAKIKSHMDSMEEYLRRYPKSRCYRFV